MRKYTFYIVMALVMLMTTVAVAQEVPQVGNVLSRETFSLNGKWHYIVDVQEEGYYDYRMNPTPQCEAPTA